MTKPVDLIFLRHGIRSDADNIRALERVLKATDGADGPEVDNQTYDWKARVLESGIELAREVIKLHRPDRHRRIIFVGHSQGGLVCRVAVIALAGRRSGIDSAFGREIGDEVLFGHDTAGLLGSWTNYDRRRSEVVAPAIAGVVMLATPNAGALTFGQLSLIGRGVQALVRQVAPTFGVRDLEDLTSDRLFRLLQHYRVPRRIRYLSISGSAINRYTPLNHDDVESIPVVGRIGVRLERPNDWLVEDRSVDLRYAPLPTEIDDVASQFEHVRAYLDCTDVSHTGIHQNEEVFRIVRNRIASWAASTVSAQPSSPPAPGPASQPQMTLAFER